MYLINGSKELLPTPLEFLPGIAILKTWDDTESSLVVISPQTVFVIDSYMVNKTGKFHLESGEWKIGTSAIPLLKDNFLGGLLKKHMHEVLTSAAAYELKIGKVKGICVFKGDILVPLYGYKVQSDISVSSEKQLAPCIFANMSRDRMVSITQAKNLLLSLGVLQKDFPDDTLFSKEGFFQKDLLLQEDSSNSILEKLSMLEKTASSTPGLALDLFRNKIADYQEKELSVRLLNYWRHATETLAAAFGKSSFYLPVALVASTQAGILDGIHVIADGLMFYVRFTNSGTKISLSNELEEGKPLGVWADNYRFPNGLTSLADLYEFLRSHPDCLEKAHARQANDSKGVILPVTARSLSQCFQSTIYKQLFREDIVVLKELAYKKVYEVLKGFKIYDVKILTTKDIVQNGAVGYLQQQVLLNVEGVCVVFLEKIVPLSSYSTWGAVDETYGFKITDSVLLIHPANLEDVPFTQMGSLSFTEIEASHEIRAYEAFLEAISESTAVFSAATFELRSLTDAYCKQTNRPPKRWPSTAKTSRFATLKKN